LPALLGALGPRLEAGRFRKGGQGAGPERWRAWARRVVAHPWLVLVVAGAPLLLLAAQAARLNPRVPSGAWLPPRMESAQGLRDLVAMGRGGVADSLRLILELPEEVSAVSLEGWGASRRLAAALERDPRVARVQSLRSIVGEGENEVARVA